MGVQAVAEACYMGEGLQAVFKGALGWDYTEERSQKKRNRAIKPG